MKPRDHIILDYASLGDGETRAGEICPACSGGTSKEGSLSVSRSGGSLLWNCHRASCGFHGASSSSARPGQASSGTEARERPLYIPTTPITEAIAKLLSASYGLTGAAIEFAQLGWTGDHAGRYGRRVSFPIYGPDSRKRGTSYRSFQGADPKAIIDLQGEDSIAQCWYKMRRASSTLILVEDQLSALRLAPHVHAVALLGTNVSDAKVAEYKQGKYTRVILSLDNDATYEAIKLTLRLRGSLPINVMGLEKDIKNMSTDEFESYLGRTNLL